MRTNIGNLVHVLVSVAIVAGCLWCAGCAVPVEEDMSAPVADGDPCVYVKTTEDKHFVPDLKSCSVRSAVCWVFTPGERCEWLYQTPVVEGAESTVYRDGTIYMTEGASQLAQVHVWVHAAMDMLDLDTPGLEHNRRFAEAMEELAK